MQLESAPAVNTGTKARLLVLDEKVVLAHGIFTLTQIPVDAARTGQPAVYALAAAATPGMVAFLLRHLPSEEVT